jgi:hypothetical protein
LKPKLPEYKNGNPGPGHYDVKNRPASSLSKTAPGYSMASKIDTSSLLLKAKKDIPGPGYYNIDKTCLAVNGNFPISTYKNYAGYSKFLSCSKFPNFEKLSKS